MCYTWSVTRLPIQTVGVRELRNQVAAVLRRAENGDRVLVTVDGRPVAQLGPITPSSSGDVTLWDLAGAWLLVRHLLLEVIVHERAVATA